MQPTPKRRLLTLIALTLLLPANLMAGSPTIGLRIGDFKSEINEYDRGVTYNILYIQPFSPAQSLEVMTGMTQLALPSDIAGQQKTGTLTVIPLALSYRYQYSWKQARVYFNLGTTYYLMNFAVNNKWIEQNRVLNGDPTFDRQLETQNALGIHYGTGLDYLLTHHLAANLDIRFANAQLETDVVGTESGSPIEEIHQRPFDPLTLSAGLIYTF